jgi:hypothetical protein
MNLLFEKYSLTNIMDVISYFNDLGELFPSFKDQLLFNDLEIEPFSDFEVAVLL